MHKNRDMLERVLDYLKRTPPMDQRRMRRFVGSCISRAELFQEVNRAHGSPLYVVDHGGLERDLKRLREAFSILPGSVEIFYAVKSNSMPEISSTFINQGIGLDVSSGLELERAIEAGARSLVFSGPGKTDEELLAVINHYDRVVLMIDSFGELARLDLLTRRRGMRVRAGVRITTRPEGFWRKFGIQLGDLCRFFERADRSPLVELKGLQFHTSWNLTPEAHVAFIDELGKALNTLKSMYRREIEFIDLGGGFWPEHGEWLRAAGIGQGLPSSILRPKKHDMSSAYIRESATIRTFAAGIRDALLQALPPDMDCRFFIEPGRWLCHQNVHILLSVVDVKSDDIVITDGGTNAVGWERFEHDYFPVINLSNPALDEHICNVFGSLCTPHDIWGYSYFGGGIQPGDLLLVPAQGAYTYSLRQEFIKPLPETVVVQGPINLCWPE